MILFTDFFTLMLITLQQLFIANFLNLLQDMTYRLPVAAPSYGTMCKTILLESTHIV